jgi:nicotinate-nucleotide pyrophosphorylase (carboxylating)
MDILDTIIRNALREDIHTGDITTLSVIPNPKPAKARLIAKEDFVLAGMDVAARVFTMLDPATRFNPLCHDGARCMQRDVIAEIYGADAVILQGERVALNLLQRMSGIATVTSRYVAAADGTKASIVDTRKTTPGLRLIEKYAVTVGGGGNHRAGLYDAVLIKENHIAAAAGITAAVNRARAFIPHTMKIEVETENLAEVSEAVAARADIIMLDNMDTATMRKAVALIAGRALVEASGGVTLDNVRDIAETGVDLISVGALTHSARAVDISLILETS